MALPARVQIPYISLLRRDILYTWKFHLICLFMQYKFLFLVLAGLALTSDVYAQFPGASSDRSSKYGLSITSPRVEGTLFRFCTFNDETNELRLFCGSTKERIIINARKAVESGNLESCNEISTILRVSPASDDLFLKLSVDKGLTFRQFEEDVIKDCISDLSDRSIFSPNVFIQRTEYLDVVVSFIFALVYLIRIFHLKSIVGLRSWLFPTLLPLAFVIPLFFSVLMFRMDPSPFYYFLFFAQRSWEELFLTGIFNTFAIFFLTLFFMGLTFRRQLVAIERLKIAFIYTLILNPFFFPIGFLIGLIHLFLSRYNTNNNAALERSGFNR